MRAGWRLAGRLEISALDKNSFSCLDSHTQGLCVYTVSPQLNRRRLAGPCLSAYTHPQSIVVSGRCWLAYRSTILWCLCADNAIYWPHKSAGFIKGRVGGRGGVGRGGDFEQQINEIKRWRRRGGWGVGGLCKFQPMTLWGSHWNWSYELQVVFQLECHHHSWSRFSFSFYTASMCTFTFTFGFFLLFSKSATKRRPVWLSC